MAALVLAVGDVVSPLIYAGLAASTEPPPQGFVTAIGPTAVTWQDGREQIYTVSDQGLVKFLVDLNGPGAVTFLNRKVRPQTPFGSGAGAIYGNFANVDHRSEGVVVLVGNVTSGEPLNFVDHPVAVIRLNQTGLYVVLSQDMIEVIPGA